MTTHPNDGGPAFPTDYFNRETMQDGMTLLDYFAGQAMTGFVGHNRDHPSAVAKISYAIAHAMLEARDA